MKKLSSTLILIVMLAFAFAQNKDERQHKAEIANPAAQTTQEKKDAPNPNAAKMDFKEENYNFGEVPEGPQVTHEFKFANTGKEPLILSNVHASCGCTTPSWT